MTKFLNFFVLFFALFILFLSHNYKNISNSILAIVPQSENKEILESYNKNSDFKTLYVAIKGEDKKAFEIQKKVQKELSQIEGLRLDKNLSNKYLEQYKYEYQLYLKSLNNTKIKELDIEKELIQVKDKLLNSFFPTIINKQDPLNLFETKENPLKLRLKNNSVVLEDYGILSKFTLEKNINSLKVYKRIYTKVKEIEAKYPDIKLFSTIFYFVENSQAIKEDVNKIVILALSILMILYLLILRDIKLLINVLTTLASSAILATLIITTLYEEVSIFVLVFGLSISTVAIDYMFHHYMHGNYNENKGFNKEVFFGFLTTIIAFIVISFISFELIRQIAIFTVISLSISYLHFSFLYPKIKFKFIESKKAYNFNYKLKNKYILFISLIMIAISSFTISFDTNLRNLDYKNKNLDSLDDFFKTNLNQNDKIPLLIQVNSIDDLFIKYEEIKKLIPKVSSPLDVLISKKRFENINKILKNEQFTTIKNSLIEDSIKVGFKKDFFEDSYLPKKMPSYDFDTLKKLNINFFKYKDNKYIFINLKKTDYFLIKNLEFVKPLSMKYLFDESLKTIKTEIIILGLVSLFLIIVMIFLITKKSFLFSLTFLLFPLGTILCYSFFAPFNVLHIFMIFIILAISIDYAIYSSKSLNLNTKKAIFFSLLSTFAGFGVLIFSKINSLYSIGMVATIGVLSITFLLIFTKKDI